MHLLSTIPGQVNLMQNMILIASNMHITSLRFLISCPSGKMHAHAKFYNERKNCLNYTVTLQKFKRYPIILNIKVRKIMADDV